MQRYIQQTVPKYVYSRYPQIGFSSLASHAIVLDILPQWISIGSRRRVPQGHVAEVDVIHLKLQNDFFYIKYFWPWLDILIVFRTVRTMLTGFGSK